MSDPIITPVTPTTPTASVPPAQTPDAGVVNQAESAATPAEQPFAVFKDAKSFNQRLTREARKLMNEQAKEAGFDDWQHMQEGLAALRQPPVTEASSTPANPPEGQQQVAAPTPVPSDQGEAQRLRMALTVASDLNLPTALVSRLQGETAEEMTADANRLLALFQQPVRGPGIPPAPRQNQPVTFTKAQMQDAKFVREHADELRRAMAEGRIVNS